MARLGPKISCEQKCQHLHDETDLVPALLKHAGVKHVALGSHSTGTIYVMNTLLYLRDILYPQKPYVALFGDFPSSLQQV
jgi:hypothetical protein